MAVEEILGTDTGKEAFEKTDGNFVTLENKDNEINAKIISIAKRVGLYTEE